MPASLLNLPRELRDLIYTHVLDDELPPPQTEAELQDHRPSLDEQRLPVNLGDVPISYAFPVRITATPLLLASRQIHSEVQDIIGHATHTKRLRYKLDCLVLQEEAIHLTWLRVPTLAPHVAVLEVGLRLVGNSDGLFPAWWEGGGLAWRLTTNLFSVLTRFLECGPGWDKARGLEVEVGMLELDVVTSVSWRMGDGVPGEGFDRVGEEVELDVRCQDEVRANRGKVAHKLVHGIISLIVLSGSDTRLLYERIEEITISIDGETRAAFGLKCYGRLHAPR